MAKTAGFLGKGGLIVVVLFAATISSAWVFRTDITEYAAKRWLESRGISEVALKVERLGLNGLVVSGLSLGSEGELAVEHLSVRYDPWALIEGRVESVAVKGVSLHLDLRPGESPLGDLQGLLAGDRRDTTAEPMLVLPVITIEQGRVSALTPLGEIAGNVRLRFQAAESGFLSGEGEAMLKGPAEAASGTINLAPDGRIALTLDAQLAAASGVWALLPDTPPMHGDVRLTVQGEGRSSPLALKEAEQLDAAALLATTVLKGGARLSVAQMQLPRRTRNIKAQADFRFSLRGGGLEVGLKDDVSMALAALAPEIKAGLPEPVRDLLRGPISIDAEANGETPFRLAVNRSGVLSLGGSLKVQSATGAVLQLRSKSSKLFPDVSGSGVVAVTVPKVGAGEVSVADLAVSLPVNFESGEGALTVNLESPGEVRIGRYVVGDTLRSTAPLVMAIEQQQAVLSANGDLSLTGRLRGTSTGLEAGKPAQAVEAVPGEWDVTASRVEGKTRIAVSVSGGSARLPDRELGVGKLLASATVNESGRLEGRIAKAEIRHLGKPALIAPLSLSGKFDGEKGDYRFDGGMADETGALKVAIKAHHAARGRGGVNLRLRPIKFSEGGAQPEQLSPVLKQIGRVSGGLSAQAKLIWGEGKLTSGGRLALESLSFVSDQAKVSGLDGVIVFDSLLPLSTPAGQHLTVKSIDPAVPVQDVALLFSIESGEPPRLHVEEGSFLLAGGRVTVGGTVLVPGASRNSVRLAVDRLDLERLLEMVKVEGLDGTGQLNGTLPLSIADGAVAIRRGLLEAQGGGVIRFRSEAAAQALSGGGEAVTLMLKALENFQYDDLKVDVLKDEKGDAQIRLHLLGHNPDVLEGHPFRFNINLEGNLDRIVAALKQGNRISGDLIRRSTGQ